MTAALMTADDLQTLPRDHQRHELVKGELTTSSPTGDLHGARTFQLTVIIGTYIRAHDLGMGFGAKTGFLLERAPDFALISKARIARQGLTGKFYPAAPDLAIEVLSPSEQRLRHARKD
jgi:Uma2 family endonuclease